MSFRLHPEQDALFLDIDGTLLDIAPTPGGVDVPQNLRDNLATLYKKLDGALALISGRSLDDIDTLFSPLHLPASGVHGAEWCLGTKKEEKTPLPEKMRGEIKEVFSSYPALILEDKKYAVAVHCRQAPEMAGTIENILREIISGTDRSLVIMPGKMVFEVICHGHNKGTAIEHFMKCKPFAGRRPVFLGDDETDVFAINTCRKMGGVGIRVEENEEVFQSPLAVREWISRQSTTVSPVF